MRFFFAFFRHKGAVPLSPKDLGIALLRPRYRFNNSQALHYWYRKPDQAPDAGPDGTPPGRAQGERTA